MKRLAVVLGGLAAVALIGVLARGFGRDPHAVPFMLQGKPAPGFALRPLEGGPEVTLAALRGRPVVINFWASWCKPCVQEHPVLEWAAREHGQRAQFLGILFEDTEENGRAFLARHGASFPQLTDPRSATAVDFGVAGVPETYFIDARGIIRGKHVGPLDPETLVRRLRALDEEPPTSTTQRP